MIKDHHEVVNVWNKATLWHYWCLSCNISGAQRDNERAATEDGRLHAGGAQP